MEPADTERKLKKPSKMLSFRLEDANVEAMDRFARAAKISRSDWIRRAILAQLVADWFDADGEEVIVVPVAVIEQAEEERVNRWG
jgi:hypothetical protein